MYTLVFFHNNQMYALAFNAPTARQHRQRVLEESENCSIERETTDFKKCHGFHDASTIPVVESQKKNNHNFLTNRRSLLLTAVATATGLSLQPEPSHAGLLLFAEAPRRQLELCLVSLLRLVYWAELTATALQGDNDPDIRKSRYLEARLASKALVTGKVGGGANLRVFNLNSLQCKGVLTDLVGYAGDITSSSYSKAEATQRRKRMEDLQTDLLESLASIVEFDGLETTIDPSPRSSLTMSMYTEAKAVFVRRTLLERVVPTTNAILRLFSDVIPSCETYVANTYPEELPPRLQVSTQAQS